jgi:transcriptional accessory protein Tex/SPT6
MFLIILSDNTVKRRIDEMAQNVKDILLELTNNNNKDQAENTKGTRRKTAQEQNTNGKYAECDHVKKRQQTKKAAKQNP